MKFWKEHGTLRIAAITACFVLGLSLVLGGWVQTGKLPGLVTMMVGLVFLFGRDYDL